MKDPVLLKRGDTEMELSDRGKKKKMEIKDNLGLEKERCLLQGERKIASAREGAYCIKSLVMIVRFQGGGGGGIQGVGRGKNLPTFRSFLRHCGGRKTNSRPLGNCV